MKKELAKNYDFKSVEDRIYQDWLTKKYFHAEVDTGKKPFTIVIPPPNVTGQLHMGHALNNTMQDILIRAKKMQGYNALWVPGCDHASISTELKIVEALAEEGLTKEDLGREKYLERAWKWKETYGGRILHQLQRLGCACDWDRERFTMDEGLSGAVLEVFVRMYNEGLIYRGKRLINWCPKCATSISDAEVDHEEKDGSLWHLCYETGDGEKLCFATTRPETMLGDTALAVNPNDGRYTKYVGRTVKVPVVNRQIPVIADEYVDMEFGTGIVKITPGHDPNDYEVGLRHKLPIINIMNDDGTMNENAGKYSGYTTQDCRRAIVEEFDKLGLFVKKEAIRHSVGIHERCGETSEPLVRKQWFVKMEELAKPAIDVYLNKELNIFPGRFGKVYLNWLYNIKDWCISRQLWWGHRIPAYFCDACGKITVAKEAPQKCECGATSLRQDEDVLDTWFSSALWPFSTLGWPDDTPELNYFYPTNVLVTAYEILFFWVIRMVFSGLYHTKQLPFKDVLFHGIVRDAEGRKMSKSLGNGIDPLDVIDKYGADALRISLIMGSSTDSDSRFKWEKVDASRNFLNKIWNATRFILMFDGDAQTGDASLLTPADKWILSLANNLSQEVTDNIEKYELGIAVNKIYAFLWDEFCDWYIEMVKPRLYNNEDETKPAALHTLKTVLIGAMKLLHPFMPFITEEIFTSIQDEEASIMTSSWPVYIVQLKFEKEEAEIELIKNAVKNIRNIRAEMNVAPSKKIEAIIVSGDAVVRETFTGAENFVKTLAALQTLDITDNIKTENEKYITSVIPGAVIYLPIAELIDVEKELSRLGKEKSKLENEMKRAESKLANEGFLSKAPKALIDEETEKLEKYKAMLIKTDEQIKRLTN